MKNNKFKLLVMSLLANVFITGCSVQAQDQYRRSPRYDRYRGHHDNHRRDNRHYDDHRRDNDYHDRRN